MSKRFSCKRECHKLMNEIFTNKAVAYAWLHKNFKINHLSDLDDIKDSQLLHDIWARMYKMSISHP